MKMLKNKWLSIILMITLCMQMFAFALPTMAAEGLDVNQALDKTLGYYNLQENYDDWEALGLRYSGAETSSKYSLGKLESASDYGRTILGSIASDCSKDTVQGYIYALQEMQTVSEEVYAGQFSSTDNAGLNQTVWAVIALDFAGNNGFEINYNRDAALDYLCKQQADNGGFDEWGYGYIDVDSTAHALVALAPEKNKYSEVIHKALVYLKSQQCDSGAFLNFGSANSDSTAVVIEALMALGEDPCNPSGQGWKGNMVEALMSYQSPEGWFVSSWETSPYNNPSQPNVMSTRNALLALVDLVNGQSKYQHQVPDTTYVPGNSGDPATKPTDPKPDYITVYVAVVGKDKQLLYRPGPVRLSKNNEFGYSVMGALDATGVDWAFASGYYGFVERIENDSNEGMNGWCAKVNEAGLTASATNVPVVDGDQVIWWYSMNADFTGPSWNSLLSGNISQGVQQEEKKLTQIIQPLQQELTKIAEGSCLLNADKKMTLEAAKKLQQKLAANSVTLSQQINTEGSFLEDQNGEVYLHIPETALTEARTITIKEKLPENEHFNAGVKFNSPIYEFGPDGTKFDKKVTMIITVPPVEGVDFTKIVPAWFDVKQGEWIPVVPFVVDMETGRVAFNVDHFTSFAIIQKEVVNNLPEEKPTIINFTDIDDFSWAKEAIEILAAWGIIEGSDKGFEPARQISRAELLAMLTRSIEASKVDELPVEFSDVKNSDWFYEYVLTAVANSWITGYPDNTFQPDKPITRYELACLLKRVNNNSALVREVSAFSDEKDFPYWVVEAVKHAKSAGLMNGYPDGSFHGENYLNRAEAAVVIYNYIKNYKN